MRITYIGLKASKTDNVAGTGLTWAQGQSHEVASVDACAKLLRHADVWAAEAPDVPETDFGDTNKPDEVMPELDALRSRLDALGIKYHHKAGVEKLQALLDQNEAPK